MELYIIRHAQSANNALWAATGTSDGRQPDPPLTEIGHQQARLLADFLAEGTIEKEPNTYAQRHNRGGFGLTHLYTSLMVRSVATAGYIAARTGLRPTAWQDIHERGGLHHTDAATGEEVGVPGPGRSFFVKEFPDLVLPQNLSESGWWQRPPEAVEDSFPRALRVWDALADRHGGTDDRVAIVSHGGFFQSLLVTLIGMDATSDLKSPVAESIWFGMSNTAVSRFELADGYAVVRYLNRVDHLPGDLITG